jgi:hypothetical protein
LPHIWITACSLALQRPELALRLLLAGVKLDAGTIVEAIASAVGSDGITPTIRELLGKTHVLPTAMFPGGRSKTEGMLTVL